MIKENSRISIVPPQIMPNKIMSIKTLRCLTGIGLKESKDACESPGRTIIFSINHCYYNSFPNPEQEYQKDINVLLGQGFKLSATYELIIQDLRELATRALNIQEDELANEILQFVLKEKLRGKIN